MRFLLYFVYEIWVQTHTSCPQNEANQVVQPRGVSYKFLTSHRLFLSFNLVSLVELNKAMECVA